MLLPQAGTAAGIALTLLEVGILLLVLGLLSRMASSMRITSVPLFIVVGLAFGDEGLIPLNFSTAFVATAAEIGAILLLFFLGLEYSARQVVDEMRRQRRTALADLVLNAAPGAALAVASGWGWQVALALAGVTYVSSSGIVSQVAREMGWRGKGEYSVQVSMLVLEDLVMAPYLPVLASLAGAASLAAGLTSVGIGLLVVAFVLLAGVREIHVLNRLFDANAPGALLLTALGLALAVGGFAANVGFSSAVAAFLVGLLLTGDIAYAVRHRLAPLRDVFSAVFFIFFGLQTNPMTLQDAVVPAFILVVITIATKILTVAYALRASHIVSDGHPWRAALRGGSLMSARGEFSVVVATLALAIPGIPDVWSGLVAAYIIGTAIAGPLLARMFDTWPRQKAVA